MNSPKKKTKVGKKANILINLFLKIYKEKMDFILIGVDQTKIKHSERNSELKQNLTNLDINQTKSS